MKNNFTFNKTSEVKINRSKFDLSHNVYGSMNVGTLYPIDIIEVLPGDTFRINNITETRLTSAYVKPVMQNLIQEFYYFFVPSRLCMDQWAEFLGENTSKWARQEEIEVPNIINEGMGTGTIDETVAKWIYNAAPTADDLNNYSALPARAFAMIYNEWFRDENLIDETYIFKGTDNTGQTEASFNSNTWSPTNYTGKLPKVAKLHDFWTSMLPAPQKGDAIEILPEFLPLRTNANTYRPVDQFTSVAVVEDDYWVRFSNDQDIDESGEAELVLSNGNLTPTDVYTPQPGNTPIDRTNLGIYPKDKGESNYNYNDLGLANGGGLTANDIRVAMQLQRLLEKEARGGTRLREIILSQFGVLNSDVRMMIPELLSGFSYELNMQQVAQTSGTTSGAGELGGLAGYSLTYGQTGFNKSFTEHGYIFCVSFLRYKHIYPYMTQRSFQRKKKLDYYNPVFANIGEQPYYKYEIYNLHDDNTSIFGYNEAWSEYRYIPDQIKGDLNTERTILTTPTLGELYTFRDVYASAPVLGQTFIEETADYVDSSLTAPSTSLPNVVFKSKFSISAIRPMPLYSIPGLMDHN